MSRADDFKKRLDALSNARLVGSDYLRAQFPGMLVEDDPELGRPRIRRNVRSEVSRLLKETGTTQMKLAAILGIHYQNFNHFLLGHRPLPLPFIEELLFLLGEEKEGEGEV